MKDRIFDKAERIGCDLLGVVNPGYKNGSYTTAEQLQQLASMNDPAAIRAALEVYDNRNAPTSTITPYTHK